MNWIIGGTYLIGCSIMDIKKREISLIYCAIFFAIELIYIFLFDARNNVEIYLAVIPGIVFVLISIISNQNIGLGDGLMLIILGLIFSVIDVISIIFWGMSSVVIFYIFAKYIFKYKVDKAIPAAPFFLVGEIVIGIFNLTGI